MSKIVSIGTAVPGFRHEQSSILHFMQRIYAFNEGDKRKLRFLYNQSSIDARYSVISDYSRPLPEWRFYPQAENLDPFPSLEQRMVYYQRYAGPLSVDAIRNCLEGKIRDKEITHLITVSCTGMSAPGLDLQVMELLDLPKTIYRTSVNFMGCYAAIHALKMADAICNTNTSAKVLIVCTELCTLHFQREATIDNIASSLLFGDGSAAVLVTPDEHKLRGLHLNNFYSEVIPKGKKDMAWELSSTGFLMTLSGYVPELIEEDFEPLVKRSLQNTAISPDKITHWCVHPGGKKILEAIHKSLQFKNGELRNSYDVLRRYGNMSSPTILFVLKEMMDEFVHQHTENATVYGAAFGPGLTMETFVASM
ncbi:MAG: type III polyketide synthase [Chitinophagaceae bacterium]|nr:type III polyketide synthase [Chitinophagaceae bacterium]